MGDDAMRAIGERGYGTPARVDPSSASDLVRERSHATHDTVTRRDNVSNDARDATLQPHGDSRRRSCGEEDSPRCGRWTRDVRATIERDDGDEESILRRRSRRRGWDRAIAFALAQDEPAD